MGLQRTRHALIFANGEPPSRRLADRYLKECDLFVCSDGGANTADRYGLNPHVVLGDLDSVRPGVLRRLRTADVLLRPDQNSTDLEKTLQWVVSRGYRRITVLGATGGRLDHAAGNISALARFARIADIRFVDATGELRPVGRAVTLDVPRGTSISLIPLGRCSGVRTTGLRWNLRDEVLAPGVRDSTSNVVRSRPVRIRVRRGTLLLFRVFRRADTP